MQSIKKLSEELNVKFSALVGKIMISLGLLLLLLFSCYVVVSVASILIVQFFSSSLSAFISFALVLFVYSMIFVLYYGAMVLITRLERNMSASLGYLFLGFKHKKTSGAVAIFTGILFWCIMASVIPIVMNVDMTNPNSLLELFKDTEKFTKLSRYVILIFTSLFIILFFRFSFVWIIMYDQSEMTAVKAFVKSWKMFKGHVLHFFGFEIYTCRRYILTILFIDAARALLYFFAKKGLESFFGYLFGFVGFISVFLMFAKISLSIPFYYDKLNCISTESAEGEPHNIDDSNGNEASDD